MFKRILVPVDLADTDLAKSAIETAVSLSRASGGSIRLLTVLPATPVMLAEYVPDDFDARIESATEIVPLKIYFYQGEMRSGFGADAIDKAIQGYRDQVLKDRLAARSLPENFARPVETVRKNTQGEHLRPIDGLLARLTVGQHTREFRHLGKPAAILLLFDFNGQRHGTPPSGVRQDGALYGILQTSIELALLR